MRILLLIPIFILTILLIGKKVFNSAKKNLYKDQEAWSGKDIKIKYSDSKETAKSNGIDNYLKVIANESKVFLEDQSKEEEE